MAPNDLRSSGLRAVASTSVTGSTAGATPVPGGPSPWQTGTHFSRYEIDSRLAVGGMAEVWRAKIKGVRGFEKRIVIKTMQTQLAARPDMVQMFIDEATMAAGLNHPNIAHVFDFGQLEGRYFIAMEYVSGFTLRFANKRMLARGDRLPVVTTLHIMIDLCEALQSVHDLSDREGPLGLIHRDLSPDNLIVATSGSAKLIDFGAARATMRTPQPALFVGKYRYAAPERILNTSEDRRSDIYSVGVILYECLTGARPFDGADAELIKAVQAGRPRDPRERAPELPASVAEAVLRAMAREPEARFATARDLGEALRACLAALGGSTKERDVTASLAALIEAASVTPPPILLRPPPEAIPEPIETSAGATSDVDLALCEVEIIEASGPIRVPTDPPPAPAVAHAKVAAPSPRKPRPTEPSLPQWTPPGQPFNRTLSGVPTPAPTVLGWRRTPEPPLPESQRGPLQHAVELFDRGLELRAAGRYGEALQAWERAWALAPENRVYAANVDRLREQLENLRQAERQLADWTGGTKTDPVE